MNSRPSRLPEPSRSSRRSRVDKREDKDRHKSKSKDRSKEEKSKDKDRKKDKEKKHSSKEGSSSKEKKHREKESSKKIAEPPPPPPKPPTPPQEEYPEDFEDYEDDFESDDDEIVAPSKVEEKKEVYSNEIDSGTDTGAHSSRSAGDSGKENAARSAEVEPPHVEVEETPMMRRLQSRQGGRRAEPVKQQTTRIVSASERKINFDSGISSYNAVALSESDTRYRILRNLIGGLERKTTVLLAQPPVKDYDFYIEMFGDSGRSQTYTQTGEDDMNEESQTEVEETITKWTQHPANDDIGWGVEGESLMALGQEDADLQLFRGTGLRNEQLRRFMDVTAGVMVDLVSSGQSKGEYFSMQNKSRLTFTAGYNTFQLQPAATKSRSTSIARSSRDEHSLLCAFFVEESQHSFIINKTALIEFHMERQQPPQRAFLADNQVNSTKYSEDGSILFAGLADGSVVAWDLYESAMSFDRRLPWLDSREGLILREPSFDTSFMATTIHDGRTAAIISVHVVVGESGPIQLCCLDECGTVSTWTVTREAKPSLAVGSRPGSRLLLSLSSLVRPDPTILRQSSSGFLIANCLSAVPSNPLQFFVGTDIGFIVNVSRSKGASYTGPRLYKSPMHVFGEVLCMRFSPFDDKILAAGLSTGSVSLHRSGQSSPMVVLTPPSSSRTAVFALEWSPIIHSVFYTFHNSRHLLTWNLATGKVPAFINDLSTENIPKVITTNIWHEKASDRETSGIAYLALGLEDGQVHVHALEPVKVTTNHPLLGILKRMQAGI